MMRLKYGKAHVQTATSSRALLGLPQPPDVVPWLDLFDVPQQWISDYIRNHKQLSRYQKPLDYFEQSHARQLLLARMDATMVLLPTMKPAWMLAIQNLVARGALPYEVRYFGAGHNKIVCRNYSYQLPANPEHTWHVLLGLTLAERSNMDDPYLVNPGYLLDMAVTTGSAGRTLNLSYDAFRLALHMTIHTELGL